MSVQTSGTARTGHWQNWGRSAAADPERVLHPGDAGEVARMVAEAHTRGRQLKVVGSGHSFTAIAAPAQDQLVMDRVRGLVSVDRDRNRVRVLGGTPLHELNRILDGLGLAMPNLGDIDRQTITGAISTGTHGTGASLPGLAAAVCGLTLVTGDGGVLTCSDEDDPDLLRAARVGLGALGIVTEVELAVVPAYRLRAEESPGTLEPTLAAFPQLVADNRNVEFYWFPHTDRVLLKIDNIAEAGDPTPPLPRWRSRLDDELLSNDVFGLVNRAVAHRPSVIPAVNRLTSRVLSARTYADVSHRVLCTPRTVRFTESEYAVPRDALVPVLTQLRRWVDASGEGLPFPVEVRVAAADDTWLSTGYERENAYIAVHQYYRMDNRAYFAAFEAIVAEHAGRPHWGKLHTLDAERLRALYPRFGDFLAVRDRLDPDRVFGNDYLTRVLGA